MIYSMFSGDIKMDPWRKPGVFFNVGAEGGGGAILCKACMILLNFGLDDLLNFTPELFHELAGERICRRSGSDD
jgi:predicted outer membrane repeat protein